jgi:hypothetical protein
VKSVFFHPEKPMPDFFALNQESDEGSALLGNIA